MTVSLYASTASKWKNLSLHWFLLLIDEDAYMARALINGAMGYLLKTEEVETIFGAIQQAMRCEKLWTDYQLLRVRHWQHVAGNKWATLTEREKVIVSALADYRSGIEIAKALDISIKTVGNHLSHILEKVEMTNRREVARWAVRYKLVEMD